MTADAHEDFEKNPEPALGKCAQSPPGGAYRALPGESLPRSPSWRSLRFPDLVLARAAKTNQRRLRLLDEWKWKESQRTPFAILDEPPPRAISGEAATPKSCYQSQDFVSDEGPRTKRSRKCSQAWMPVVSTFRAGPVSM